MYYIYIHIYIYTYSYIHIYKRVTRLLQKRNYKLSRYGKRSFSVAAADLWNAVGLIIQLVNYSYFKSNVLLLIRKN